MTDTQPNLRDAVRRVLDEARSLHDSIIVSFAAIDNLRQALETPAPTDLTERARATAYEWLRTRPVVGMGPELTALLTAFAQSERDAVDMDTHCRTLGCLAATLRQERHAAQEKVKAAAAEARRAVIAEVARW